MSNVHTQEQWKSYKSSSWKVTKVHCNSGGHYMDNNILEPYITERRNSKRLSQAAGGQLQNYTPSTLHLGEIYNSARFFHDFPAV